MIGTLLLYLFLAGFVCFIQGIWVAEFHENSFDTLVGGNTIAPLKAWAYAPGFLGLWGLGVLVYLIDDNIENFSEDVGDFWAAWKRSVGLSS